MNIIDASWLYTMVAVKQVSTYALKLNVSVEYCSPLSTSQEVGTSSSLPTLAILEPSHHTQFLRSSIIFIELNPFKFSFETETIPLYHKVNFIKTLSRTRPFSSRSLPLHCLSLFVLHLPFLSIHLDVFFHVISPYTLPRLLCHPSISCYMLQRYFITPVSLPFFLVSRFRSCVILVLVFFYVPHISPSTYPVTFFFSLLV